LGYKSYGWKFHLEGFRKGEKQMKLNVMFSIAGVLMIVFGLVALIAPGVLLPADVGESTLIVGRLNGALFIGLGLIAWLVRNADASKARDGITLGFTIFFALFALTHLYIQFTDTSGSSHWVDVIVNALFAIGFFMAGKASMSTGAN
jgi:hypothetical protein